MKKRTLAAVLFALVSTLALFPQTARLVMVNEEWAPYRIGTNDAPGAWTGIDIDLVRELERRLGVEIVVRSAPWSRCLEMVRLAQTDILTGVAWTPERAASMRFVPTSYSEVRPAFYARTGAGASVRRYADLLGKSIGQSINSAYFEPFNSDGRLEKVSVRDEETILRMLADGRIDLAVGTEPNLAWDTARFGLKGRIEPTAWHPDQTTPLYVVLPLRDSSAPLAELIDAAIRDMLADGTMADIIRKYR